MVATGSMFAFSGVEGLALVAGRDDPCGFLVMGTTSDLGLASLMGTGLLLVLGTILSHLAGTAAENVAGRRRARAPSCAAVMSLIAMTMHHGSVSFASDPGTASIAFQAAPPDPLEEDLQRANATGGVAHFRTAAILMRAETLAGNVDLALLRAYGRQPLAAPSPLVRSNLARLTPSLRLCLRAASQRKGGWESVTDPFSAQLNWSRTVEPFIEPLRLLLVADCVMRLNEGSWDGVAADLNALVELGRAAVTRLSQEVVEMPSIEATVERLVDLAISRGAAHLDEAEAVRSFLSNLDPADPFAVAPQIEADLRFQKEVMTRAIGQDGAGRSLLRTSNGGRLSASEIREQKKIYEDATTSLLCLYRSQNPDGTPGKPWDDPTVDAILKEAKGKLVAPLAASLDTTRGLLRSGVAMRKAHEKWQGLLVSKPRPDGAWALRSAATMWLVESFGERPSQPPPRGIPERTRREPSDEVITQLRTALASEHCQLSLLGTLVGLAPADWITVPGYCGALADLGAALTCVPPEATSAIARDRMELAVRLAVLLSKEEKLAGPLAAARILQSAIDAVASLPPESRLACRPVFESLAEPDPLGFGRFTKGAATADAGAKLYELLGPGVALKERSPPATATPTDRDLMNGWDRAATSGADWGLGSDWCDLTWVLPDRTAHVIRDAIGGDKLFADASPSERREAIKGELAALAARFSHRPAALPGEPAE
ncbi:MAG: hypothetical protein U0574_00735 [Phycisphaerales bacterium]